MEPLVHKSLPLPPSPLGLEIFMESRGWCGERYTVGNAVWPLLQGILAVADAVKAADMGVEGIIISNHGGRQLDFAPAAIDVLPGIAKAVKGRGVTLLVDGGIRRGTDVIKVLHCFDALPLHTHEA